MTLDFGDTPPLCRGFALRLVRGVRNGPSPEWLRRRLTAIGLRPINALVDITNYITFDRGRPLHVFDAAKVFGDLVVRRAREGETLLALDGKSYPLDPSICVIADRNGVESLAGIMGGEASGCSEATTDVLIESALWDEFNIAHTGRKLGINSDARYRFERGVDPAFMVPGLELATRMVLDLCGGTASAIIVAGASAIPDRAIDFPLAEVKRLAGIELPPADIAGILGRLGFGVRGDEPVATVTVPTWRPDVHGKADLVEEIVRIVGVDSVPMTPFGRGDAPASRSSPWRKCAPAKPSARSRPAGWWRPSPGRSSRNHRRNCSAAAKPNSRSPTRSRPTCRTCGRASFRGWSRPPSAMPIAAMAIRRCSRSDRFSAATGRRINSSPRAACAAGGRRLWAADATGRPAAKASMLSTSRPTHSPRWRRPALPCRRCKSCPAAHPGCTRAAAARSRSGRKTCSAISASCTRRRSKRSAPKARWWRWNWCSIASPSRNPRPTRAKPPLDLSAFQPVERDFAFIVDRGVKAGDIVRAAQGVDRKLITGITVFDVYEGAGIDPAKKSVAIAVTLQPRDKTLTEAEIDAVAAKIVAEVGKRTGGVLRG